MARAIKFVVPIMYVPAAAQLALILVIGQAEFPPRKKKKEQPVLQLWHYRTSLTEVKKELVNII